MKEKIVNNLGLKLLSLVCAFLLWITIVNVIDPSDDRTIVSIPVNMINKETLTEMGYTYEVLEGNTVTVTVVGPKSIVDTLTVTDFYASADFATVTQLSDYVDINVVCIKNGINQSDLDIQLKNNMVKLNIENRESRIVDVDVNITGEPASGYITGDYDVSPMSIKITGAESVVGSVSTAIAEYNVQGASLDVSEDVVLKLYDEEGNEISTDGLVMSRDRVRLKVPLLVKKVVPVNYAYKGNVKEGYKISKLTYSIENLILAGEESVISNISSIDIPAELIDVTDISEDASYTVRLSHYVPAGVKIISSAVADVVVNVEPLITKEFAIAADNIRLENANDELSYDFVKKSILVTYSGLATDIEAITIAGIKASVDVSDTSLGVNTVKLILQNTNNCTVVGEYSVVINVSK